MAGDMSTIDKHRRILLQGVNEIHVAGTPGPLCTFGGSAFPVILGNSSSGGTAPVVAAAVCGRGKLVAYGHPGYVDDCSTGDNNAFLKNCLDWFGGAEDKHQLNVALYQEEDSLIDFIASLGHKAEIITDLDELNDPEIDVVCVCTHSLPLGDDLDVFDSFLRRGGCAIVTGVGWGWQQKHSGEDLTTQHPGNFLLCPYGIAWSSGYLSKTGKVGFLVERNPSYSCSHSEDHLARPISVDKSKAAVVSNNTDIHSLLEGIREIHVCGLPGPLCVFGTNSFPLILGKVSPGVLAPVVAGCRFGSSGKVIAYGHTAYLNPKDEGDNNALLINCIKWFSPSKRPLIATYDEDDIIPFLRSCHYQVESIDSLEVLKNGKYGVIFASSHSFTGADDTNIVADFLLHGGSAILTGLGWGWAQLNPKKDLRYDHPGNRLLGPFGLVWADGSLSKTGSFGFKTRLHKNYSHVKDAMNILKEPDIHTAKEKRGACGVICRAIPSLPADDTEVLPALRDLHNDQDRANIKLPKENNPIIPTDVLTRVALAREIFNMESGDKDEETQVCKMAAEEFPGKVPPDAPVSTGSEAIMVDCSQYRWRSTGYYAPPGKRITVKVESGAERITEEWFLQIGSHTDLLWDKEDWYRAPCIVVRKALKPDQIIMNPFGGLIYIDIPEGAIGDPVDLRISGAVESPRFVLGQTSNASNWRSKPAPWAELESKKLIFTVPTKSVQALDDPTSLMEHWDKVLDAMADLAQTAKDRQYPERIVADVQISCGYMHAGYPIMIHNDVAVSNMLTLSDVLNGKDLWGVFHELGHNHQSDNWTFSGTTEVTVNFFTMFVIDKLCETALDEFRSALSPEGQKLEFKEHVSAGSPYATWQDSPFLALITFHQMQKEFGWEAFQKFFAQFHEPNAVLPESDDEIRDQWVTRFSTIVNRNLGPFFDKWGIPVSDEAKAQVEHLETWFPK